MTQILHSVWCFKNFFTLSPASLPCLLSLCSPSLPITLPPLSMRSWWEPLLLYSFFLPFFASVTLLTPYALSKLYSVL